MKAVRTLAAGLSAAALLTLSSPALAGLVLQVDGAGDGYTTVDSDASGSVVTYSGLHEGFLVTLVAGSSNSPGSDPQAELNTTTLTIENVSAGDGATFSLLLGDTGFTYPTIGEIQLNTGYGGSVTVATDASSITHQTWVDGANAQNSMAGITSGALTLDLSSKINGDNFSDGNSVIGTLLSVPFSFTALTSITMDEGGKINFATSAVAAKVPEPSTLMLLGLGLLGLAGVRRNAR